MRFISHSLLCLALLLSTPLLSAQTTESQQRWTQLISKVQSKQAELSEMITKVKVSGQDVSRAETSRITIAEFLKASQWDYQHPEVIEKLYQNPRFKTIASEKKHLTHPFDQLEDCLDVASYALDELQKQLSGQLKLSAPPNLYAGLKTVNGPDIELNGRPVIPVTLNFLPNTKAFQQAYGKFGGSHHFMSHFIEANGGSIHPNVLKQRIARTKGRLETNQDPIVHFHGHTSGLPKWMLREEFDIKLTNKDPRTYNGGRAFFNYDISNPHIQGWQKSALSHLAPALAAVRKEKGIMIHMLANEPNFSVRAGGWGVKNGGFTPFMVESYRQWLTKKYQTISQLNESHGTSWADFTSIPSPFPIDVEKTAGTALHYDVCRWNMDRVNDYFRLLRNAVKKGDPTAYINLKLLGGTLVRGDRSDGMDFETLTKLMDITGCDSEAAPAKATFLYNAPDRSAGNSWLKNYSFHWSEQTMFTDYAKSLKPNAPHYNSEWHGLSTLSWRDFDIQREYVRAGLWTLASHGTNLIETWAWGRNRDGSISGRVSLPGSAANQPIAMDEHGRTAKDLNVFAPQLSALGNAARPIRIFYSEAAAIQDHAYGEDQKLVYESLKLLGNNVGMTTESEIGKLNPTEHLIVIPPSHYLRDPELAALQSYQAKGGKILLIEKTTPTPEPFAQKTELGKIRSSLPLNLKNRVSFSSTPYLLAEILRPEIAKLSPAPTHHLIPTITDKNGQPALGIITQQVNDPKTDQLIILLTNVRKEPLNITLKNQKHPSPKFENLLTGNHLEGPQQLKPMDILFLRLAKN